MAESTTMSAAEAAEYLGIKKATLYAYVSRRLLVSFADAGDTRRRRYRRADLDRLKRRSDAHAGHGAAAAAALDWGAPSLETSLSEITVAGPAYRGWPLAALVRERAPFESVAELLWTGRMPEATPDWFADAPAPIDLVGIVPDGAWPIDVLRVVTLLAGLDDATRFGTDEASELRVGRRLIAGAAATLSAQRGSTPGAWPTVASTLAAAFGAGTSATVRRSIDTALVVTADHELNASTFAARVAASTGADVYASVSAALATFAGPRHGGGCDRCAALVAEVEANGSARSVFAARMQRGEAVPGFGHKLYPDGDPRFTLLAEVAVERGAPTAAIGDMLAVGANMQLGAPTLDMGLVLLMRSLGLPDAAAVTLFAVGRMAGWVAHAYEQRRQGFLLRPRARYVAAP